MIQESYRWRSKSRGEAEARRLISRRTFLAGAAAVEVSPFDLSLLDTGVTPAELFFVREHFPAPAVDPVGWQLGVAGGGAGAFTIRHADFVKLARHALAATLECAENPAGGGLVSHAEWEGVRLATIIELAKPGTGTQFVRLTGADGFARLLPIEKARQADTLLAFRMNGESLPPSHGAPVRAVIPGWYGVSSIKWISRVELLAEAGAEAAGYRRGTRSLLAGVTQGEAVSRTLIKSVFSRPTDGAILYTRRFTLRGAAWAGESAVRSVEVSTDGGRTWAGARLAPTTAKYAWTHWAFDWKIPARGPFELIVRATDAAGLTQPGERDASRVDEYEHNHWHRIKVTAA